MPRSARLYYPGGYFHLISRFYNHQRLMEGAAERLRYLHLHEKIAERSDATVLAWCLMSSHIHLVVRAGEAPLSELMKAVNTGFATWLNRHRGRIGAVFADRYKSILVEDEPYLLQLVRYVHNNPVRAKVAASPADSPWSSHRAYTGLEATPDWLNTDLVLGRFSPTRSQAQKKFHEFTLEGIDECTRADLSDHDGDTAARKLVRIVGDGTRLSDAIVGSQEFASEVLEQMGGYTGINLSALDQGQMAAQRPSLEEVIATTCAVVGLEPWVFEQQPKSRLSVHARRIITWLWVRRFGGRQVDLARHFNVASSLVSRWYGRAVANLPDLEVEADQVADLVPPPSADQEEARPSDTRYSIVVHAGSW